MHLMFYPNASGGSVGETVMLSGVVAGDLIMRPIARRRF